MSETTRTDTRDIPEPPRIETLRTSRGEISFSPERGGIITSMKLRGPAGLREILYLDQATLDDPEKNVKGGVPILFPNAGPINSPDFPGMKQHGFARNMRSWESGVSEDEFWETLTADASTREKYPYDFSLRMGGRIEKNGSTIISQSPTNHDPARALPVSMGLHPYFRVPADQKQAMRFDFPGGDIIERGVEKWANDGTISVDNPALIDPRSPLRITIPELGTLVMDVSPEYRKIWVWSMMNKDFVCIEPVMRDEGGLVNDPELVPPGATYTGTVKFRLE